MNNSESLWLKNREILVYNILYQYNSSNEPTVSIKMRNMLLIFCTSSGISVKPKKYTLMSVSTKMHHFLVIVHVCNINIIYKLYCVGASGPWGPQSAIKCATHQHTWITAYLVNVNRPQLCNMTVCGDYFQLLQHCRCNTNYHSDDYLSECHH